ncbi:beta-ketoacyl-[acyl-carrier-protein] synthase family protein [Agrobacterium vitis]|nr:hypothetical protein [Agrobacterium vitis]MCM2451866.1 hypothetical protein [Agrobacterium vitis]
MLSRGAYVPFLSGQQAMSHYAMESSPFFFPREHSAWNISRRVAALSSFADGGTNAHLILEEGAQGQDTRRQPVAPPSLNRRDLHKDGLELPPPSSAMNWWESVSHTQTASGASARTRENALSCALMTE